MGFGVRQLGLDPGSSTDKLVRLKKTKTKTKNTLEPLEAGNAQSLLEGRASAQV